MQETDSPITAEQFAVQTSRIIASVSSVIDGKPDAVRSALVCLLAEGHLLIEDVPGVGKTMLARALAASVDATVRRIQFTPDLLPGDVTGVSVYDPADREFEFKRGAGDGAGQRLGEHRLADARDVLDQQVTGREQRHQSQFHRLRLALDHGLDGGADVGCNGLQLVHLARWAALHDPPSGFGSRATLPGSAEGSAEHSWAGFPRPKGVREIPQWSKVE